jgi:hypothetical protein
LFDQTKLFLIITALAISLIIDVSLVKINDLFNKYFIPNLQRLLLFSAIASSSLILQFLSIKYIAGLFKGFQPHKTLRVRVTHAIWLISLIIIATLMGLLIFQQFSYNYYSMAIDIAIIGVSYGTAATFLIWLALLFFSWFRSSNNLMVFLYFISVSIIAFNLIATASYICVKLTDRPKIIGEYIGTSGDLTGSKTSILKDIYNISTFISFLSMWTTAALLMNNYKEKLINSVVYWIVLSIPLIYFIITYFYQYILGGILSSFLQIDPVTVSIALGAFLALSKPIGGLLFGIVFWKISKLVSYEKRIKTYLIISGWGVLLIFSSNQAVTQIVLPYPPFGLPSVTILITASCLMLIGIYNSATQVSANNELRKVIHNHSLKLLKPIGQAEMEKEINNAVKRISQNKDLETPETPLELDENELKRYMQHVISEVKKTN